MCDKPKSFDVELIKSLIEYKSESGEFFWKKRPHIRSAVMPGDRAGTTTNTGYIMIRIKRRGYLAHRIAWAISTGKVPEQLIDHINGVRSDNRIGNLRLVTVSQNTQNQRAATSRNKTSRLLGVSYFKKANKFRATININGKNKHLGCFDTEDLAHEAYMKAKKVHHISQAIEMDERIAA